MLKIYVEIEEARNSKLHWVEEAQDFLKERGYLLSEAEAYELEKQLGKQWLFDLKKPLEDNYDEDSMP